MALLGEYRCGNIATRHCSLSQPGAGPLYQCARDLVAGPAHGQYSQPYGGG